MLQKSDPPIRFVFEECIFFHYGMEVVFSHPYRIFDGMMFLIDQCLILIVLGVQILLPDPDLLSLLRSQDEDRRDPWWWIT